MKTNWDSRFLKLAEHVSTWSKDPSTQVGAVITDQKRVVSVGFNGFPSGIADNERLQDRAEKYPRVVHGEVNAILFAQRSLRWHTLYTYPFVPCSTCAGQVIQAGISRVVAPQYCPDRWKDSFTISLDMFREAGVSVVLFDIALVREVDREGVAVVNPA